MSTQIPLKEGTLFNIQYKKDDGEKTIRTVLCVKKPSNIKALDLSSLTMTEKLTVERVYSEYLQYVEAHTAKLFSFEEWCEHTSANIPPTPLKWRTFKPQNTTVLNTTIE